ncbi:MAG: ACT domain-containing protein, partial [Pseudomonadota bacterium]
LGAKVLHPRSVELAMAWNVPLQVLSSFDKKLGSDFPGTQIVREEDILEKQIVNGVTCSRNDSKVTLISVPDHPGIVASIFTPLSAAFINVDMIVQNVSPDGKSTDVTFTVPRADAEKTKHLIEDIPEMKGCSIRTANNLGKVSIIGSGMRSHTGVACTMFNAMADNGINILAITTSEIKISVLIEDKYTELAVRALHTAFRLDIDAA